MFQTRYALYCGGGGLKKASLFVKCVQSEGGASLAEESLLHIYLRNVFALRQPVFIRTISIIPPERQVFGDTPLTTPR